MNISAVYKRHNTLIPVSILSITLIGLYFLIRPLSDLDSQIVTNLPQQIPGLFAVMTAISAIGSPLSMIVLAIAWSGIELAWNRRDRALVMIGSLLAGPVFYAIKLIVQRHRPHGHEAIIFNIDPYSFPSGHATMSFAVLLTLAFLLSLRLPKKLAWAVAAVLVAFVILVGISRLYLQDHYPTDVIGGWLIGAIAVLLVRGYVLHYERRTGNSIKQHKQT